MVPPISVGAIYGGQLMLTCTVASFPGLNDVGWYRNSQQLFPTMVINKNQTAITSRYTVKSVTENDCGTYSCYSATSPSASVTGQTKSMNFVDKVYLYESLFYM